MQLKHDSRQSDTATKNNYSIFSRAIFFKLCSIITLPGTDYFYLPASANQNPLNIF